MTLKTAVVRACLAVMAFATILLAACGGDGSSAKTPAPPALRDPAARGPYNVALTKMTFERPANADGTPRKLETWIWYPTTGTPGDATPVIDAPPATSGGPFPIVIFSHGNGGQPQFHKYFTEHLASWGFIVAAPPHPGDTSADCSPCGASKLVPSARERPADVTLVLDKLIALKDDPSQPLGKIVDPTRSTLAGHSFGGWTAIFAAPDGRFNAVVAMAPGAPEILLGRGAKITVPTLILGGDKDEIVNPAGVRRLFDAIPATTAKTYVSFPEGHHLTFIDKCLGCTAALTEERGHELVNRYTTAFIETYVMKDDRYAHYLTEDVAPEAVIIHDAGAGN